MPIELQAELTTIRRAILTMGASVEQRVERAIAAVLERDAEAGMFVRGHDDEIDQMEIDIEEECLRLLALLQPVAGDLRFILAVMRMNTDLERIGDLARSIAKRSLHLTKRSPIELPDALITMAGQARQMLADALAVMAEEDVALARRVRQNDERVDDLEKEIFVWAKHEIPKHLESTSSLLDVLSVARRLERIADLSTNIAEEVIFLVEGRQVRHTAEA